MLNALRSRVAATRLHRTLLRGAVGVLALAASAGVAVTLTTAAAPTSLSPDLSADLSMVPELGEVALIVDRKDGDIELFFGLPAARITDVFAAPPQILVDADGLVTFDDLREGTWDAGDDLFAGVEARLGARSVSFEAMSVMVHPIDQRVPLNDPLDGIIAVSICMAIIPGARLPLDTLYLYAGFIGYAEETDAPLELSFTQTGRLPSIIDVREHRDGVLIRTHRVKLKDGGTLLIG